MIRKEARLFCRTSSGVRLCREIEEPKRPKEPETRTQVGGAAQVVGQMAWGGALCRAENRAHSTTVRIDSTTVRTVQLPEQLVQLHSRTVSCRL